MSYTIKVGSNGDYQVVPPESEAEIVELGRRFCEYEKSLSPGERLKWPSLNDISDALAGAQAGLEDARKEEGRRAVAATAYHNVMAQAIPLLKEAIEQLSWKHRDNLARLQDWGLKTKIGARGKVLVTKPVKEADYAAFLQTYVAKELSLTEADRITTPPCAQMQALAQAVKDNDETRTVARSARKLAVETRSAGVGPLYDRLQLACGLLIVLRFDGHVTNALEAWGFKVKQVIAVAPIEPPVPEPPTV